MNLYLLMINESNMRGKDFYSPSSSLKGVRRYTLSVTLLSKHLLYYLSNKTFHHLYPMTCGEHLKTLHYSDPATAEETLEE